MNNSSDLLQTATSPLQQELEQTTQQVLQVALKQQQSGQIKAAEDLYKAILDIQPNQADANHHLGLLAVRAGQAFTGIPHFKIALKARPDREEYWLSYLDALLQTGQLETARQVLNLGRQHGLQGEAVVCLEDRIQGLSSQTPTQLIAAHQTDGTDAVLFSVSALTKLDSTQAKVMRSGNSGKKKISRKKQGCAPNTAAITAVVELYRQGRLTEAETLARSFTERFSLHGFGWKVLGAVLQAQARFDEALLCLKEAVRLMPEDAEALFNLGASLQSQGRFVESEDSLKHALVLKPDYVEALCTLGGTLLSQGRFVESEVFLNHALALKPNYAKALSNLGTTLLSQGRLIEATTAYESALKTGPMLAAAHSNLLFCMSHNIEVVAQQLYAAHLAFGEQFEAPLRAGWQVHNNNKDPARCLQVGFVSSDLYSHAVASFLEPILVFLAEKQSLSLHAYYTYTINDQVTERLRTHFSKWHPVPSLNDDQLADKIRADGIDILIDLSGHTGHNRLLTFARKPAPIQASWMGYPGTTGLQAMDYYICDKFFVPPRELDWQFTEKMVYLPTASVFQPDASAPEVNRLPALDNGYITFGSFNRDNKINDAVIMLFAMVLQRTPSARLIMAGINLNNQPDFAERFAMAGINADQLTFYPRTNMHDYLKLHHLVDVCLDTFPYGGGTTTYHAAYMGVPTVTLAGETAASRSGASILGRLGLDDFVATSIENFAEISANLSAKVNELALTRESLRARFNASGLRQPELLSQHMEMALRTAWERWCTGTAAETITITL